MLVCLAGFSPAVVTETIYALAVTRRPRVLPHEVFIVTTGDAFATVAGALLGPTGALRKLSLDYRLPPDRLRCTPEHIVTLRDGGGKPLRDIRTSEDSRAAGEVIAALLRRLRQDPDVQLHCSIAGGRKTMGVLLACAFQLVARPGDRLYHVLVDPRFENIPTFFYPPPRPRRLRVGRRVLDARTASVDLAEIPVVRLGSAAELIGLGGDLARRAARLEAAMDERFKPPPLELDAQTATLRVAGTSVHLRPHEFALYALYAVRRAGCGFCRAARSPGCDACHLTDVEIFDHWRPWLSDWWRRAGGRGGGRLQSLLDPKVDDRRNLEEFFEWVRQTRSRIGARLKGAEASFAVEKVFGISSGRGRRGLRVAPELIRVPAVAQREPEAEERCR